MSDSTGEMVGVAQDIGGETDTSKGVPAMREARAGLSMDTPAGQPAAPPAADANTQAQAQAQAQSSRGSVSGLMVLLFLWFIFGGNHTDDLLSRHQLDDSLQSLIYQQANYSAYLRNETSNFTLVEHDKHLLPLIHHFVPPPTHHPVYGPAYYRNITGFVNGDLSIFNLTVVPDEPLASLVEPIMAGWNATESIPRLGDWNWSAGKRVSFSVLENRPSSNTSISLIHGKIDIKDETADRTIRFTLEGLHFQHNGSLFGYAEAKGRHPDLRQLPALLPEMDRNVTGLVIEAELKHRIERLRTMIASGNTPEHDSWDDVLVTSCPFVVYAQLRPAQATQAQVDLLEQEMAHPTGASTIRAPPLLVDAVLVSPECGVLLHLSGGKGLKSQSYWRKTTTFAGMGALVYMALLIVTVREIARCNTHAMLSRIGRITLTVQSCLDAFSFTAHLTFAIVADNRVSLPLIATGFLACLLLLFESQFSNSIHEVQSPEGAASSQPPPAPPPSGSSLFDLLAQAKYRVQMALRTAREYSGLLWLGGVVGFIIFLLIDASLAMMIAVCTVHFLLWTPQIYRNLRRNTRMSLSWEYVLVASGARLFFAMYIFQCPENVIGHEPQDWAFYLPWAFALQLAILFAQDRLGPAFFIPRSWNTSNAYDYYPLLPAPDPEAPEQSLGDCAICMDAILLPSTESTPSLVKHSLLTGAAVKQPYALAPCHHLFHTQCLEQWMDIKNICPQCRRPLPPM